MPSRPIIVTKCVRPGCNSYAVGLDGVSPCDECRAAGYQTAPPPLRPMPTFNGRPGVTRAERVEKVRTAVREAMPIAEAYARTAVDIYAGVQRVRRVLRKIPW